MKQLFQKIRSYMYNVNIDINERLGAFFVNIGIIAAYFGVIVCLLSHIPASGTISTALIAITAPLIVSISRHTNHPTLYGRLVGVLIIFMIPIVWLTTGAASGGSGFWFVYELFYITLFTTKKQMLPFYTGAVLIMAAAIALEYFHPELFFHFDDSTDAMVSRIGSGIVVTIEIMVTVIVQKTLYVYEREVNTKTQDQTRNFVTSIANTIDTKDPYTGGHSRRVAECSAALARRLGMSQEEADNIYFIGLLHDIGKIGVPDSVLNKPGRLTAQETALIRKHPVYGAEILKDVSMLPHVHEGVLYHHERYDGTGYPEGLKGEAIPYVARIIAVADTYDAMSTNRVYRKSLPREEIIREMNSCRGTQFDPYIVDVFVSMLKEGFKIETTELNTVVSIEENLEVTASMMMRRILSDTQLLNPKTGAKDVDNDVFPNMYNYLLCLSRRYGIELTLITISLEKAGEPLKSDSLIAAVTDLNSSITQSIRSVDICTRYGTNSFLLLLLNAPVNTVPLVFNRINRIFIERMERTDVTLSYNIIEPSVQAATTKTQNSSAEHASEAEKRN